MKLDKYAPMATFAIDEALKKWRAEHPKEAALADKAERDAIIAEADAVWAEARAERQRDMEAAREKFSTSMDKIRADFAKSCS